MFIGVLVKDANAVLAFSFMSFLHLQLGTSLGAPTSTLPGWLRTWAHINPATHVMDACRALLNDTPAGDTITNTDLVRDALRRLLSPRRARLQPPAMTGPRRRWRRCRGSFMRELS